MSLVYIGKKVPKGLREVGPAMHLGRGMWAFSVEPDPLAVLGETTTMGGRDFTTIRPAPKRRATKKKGGKRV